MKSKFLLYLMKYGKIHGLEGEAVIFEATAETVKAKDTQPFLAKLLAATSAKTGGDIFVPVKVYLKDVAEANFEDITLPELLQRIEPVNSSS